MDWNDEWDKLRERSRYGCVPFFWCCFVGYSDFMDCIDVVIKIIIIFVKNY
ncbi:MAG: hypothetical protein LBP59_18565 [Planctomycetaceae bacterium]|nr:hypothetical protein [Planctomycetaceae bacterium]